MSNNDFVAWWLNTEFGKKKILIGRLPVQLVTGNTSTKSLMLKQVNRGLCVVNITKSLIIQLVGDIK
jgi:hypothetical protein